MKFARALILSLVIIVSIAVPVSVSFVLTGCNTPQQTVTYKTLYGIETATGAAFDSYVTLILDGKLNANQLPAVKEKFNQFQASMKVAVDLAQNNTNAFASANLVIESQDIINLITTLKGAKK